MHSFGKFGSHYLKREFYFDVHPPLGKMLVGLSGYLAGYNGSFEFKSGEVYPEELNYTFMRAFNSTFGALCVPLAYYTAKELNFRKPACWLAALMVLCDNSLATISRFILLDSMLLFFTFTTVFCWAKFHRLQHDPFSPEWGLWLMLCGVSIGCVCSVKWVGFFATALVGLYTIEDLWNKFGDLRMPKVELAAHLGFRVFSLIMIPMMVYLFSFWLHFLILENSGPGDAQMSSLFQANLRGTEVGKDSPLELAIGSRATIKNMGYGGGLLHSHVQTYPEGSQQQQVTCYHHKDANNDWFIYPNRFEPDYNVGEEPMRFPQDGSTIRLIHAQTGRNLHSHQIAAPVTKADWEVSSYGNVTIGDTKDHWQIEVVNDAATRDYSKIRTLTTSFRLKHPDLGCYLRAGNVNLPQWGFKQIEVTCTKTNNPRDVYTHWNVESHWNDRLPAGDPGAYKSPFFRDFIHLNVAMMTSNNALVPDPDKQDDLASAPWQWPILHVGLRMCGWGDDSKSIYCVLVSFLLTFIRSCQILPPGQPLRLLVFYRLSRRRRPRHRLVPYSLAAWICGAQACGNRPDPLRWNLPHHRLVPPLLPIRCHGSCHIRSPLLPGPLLCYPFLLFPGRLVHQERAYTDQVGCLQHPLCYHPRTFHPLPRHHFRHGRTKCAVEPSEVVQHVARYGRVRWTDSFLSFF